MLLCFHLLLSAVEWTRRQLVEAGATSLVRPDFLLAASADPTEDDADDGDGDSRSLIEVREWLGELGGLEVERRLRRVVWSGRSSPGVKRGGEPLIPPLATSPRAAEVQCWFCLQELCGLFDASVLDAKHLHVHWWRALAEK